jgi:hypothetical protein
MRNLKKYIAAALAAAVVLTSIGITSADARSRHHNRGNAAAAAAVIGLFGTVAALAAADSYRGRYYYGSPYDGPYAYGPAYGYAPRYYGYRHHHRHWR